MAEAGIAAYVAVIAIALAIVTFILRGKGHKEDGCCDDEDMSQENIAVNPDTETVKELFEKDNAISYLDTKNMIVFIVKERYDSIKDSLKVISNNGPKWTIGLKGFEGEYTVKSKDEINPAMLVAVDDPTTFDDYECTHMSVGSCVRFASTQTSVKLRVDPTMCINKTGATCEAVLVEVKVRYYANNTTCTEPGVDMDNQKLWICELSET